MSSSSLHEATVDSSFGDDCAKSAHNACAGEIFYKDHDRRRYCVLHFPSNEKSADFNKAFQKKLNNKDFNFRAVWFPDELSLQGFDFSAKTDFSFATFSKEASFNSATFSNEASFNNATFNAEVDFSFATFNAKAYFSRAIFGDYVRFAGNKNKPIFSDTSLLDLQFARIEKPNHISFHTLTLRPSWLVNVDAREFDFTEVGWGRHSINEEVEILERKGISSPHSMLATARSAACGQYRRESSL